MTAPIEPSHTIKAVSTNETAPKVSTVRQGGVNEVTLSEGQTKDFLAHNLLAHPEQVYFLTGLHSASWLSDSVALSQGPLILWEPDGELLQDALQAQTVINALQSGRLQTYQDFSLALEALRQVVKLPDRLGIVQPLPAQAKRLARFQPDFEQRLAILEEELEIEFSSAKAFHELWLHNLARNLPQLVHSQPIQSLSNAAQGKPAILIARGPSLDEALPTLKQLSDCAVLIAVGGALRSLEQADIIPDFALFYDARGMKEQLHGLPLAYLAKIRFVHSPCSETAAFLAPCQSRYHFWTPYHTVMASWFEKITSQAQPVLERGGGSVSLLALHFAQVLGCSDIVLIGQDLAFPRQQAYAGGQDLQTDGAGNMTLPASETLISRPLPMTTVEGQDGEPLPTLAAYANFIRQFERMAHNLADKHQLFNASLGGAQIAGFTLKPLSSFTAQWQPYLKNWDALEAVFPQITNASAIATSALKMLHQQWEEGSRLCHTLGKSLGHSHQSNSTEAQKALVRFSNWLDNPSNSFARFLCAYALLRFRQPDQAKNPLDQRAKTLFAESQTLFNNALRFSGQ
jgi:hypothetical protein